MTSGGCHWLRFAATVCLLLPLPAQPLKAVFVALVSSFPPYVLVLETGNQGMEVSLCDGYFVTSAVLFAGQA